MEKKSTLHEAIADIAYIAGIARYYSGDSRADMAEFIELAEEFEKKHANTEWDEDLDYMIEIEKFVMSKLDLNALDGADRERKERVLDRKKALGVISAFLMSEDFDVSKAHSRAIKLFDLLCKK